jgi:transcription termination factor NusG
MAYWAVAQLQPQREAFALSMLARAEFKVYAPRLREWRTVRGGRQRQYELPLFPGYAFLLIRLPAATPDRPRVHHDRLPLCRFLRMQATFQAE